MKRPIIPEELEFTAEMREELSQLKKSIESGEEGPDFPWAKYQDLQERESRNNSKRSYFGAAFNSKGTSKRVAFEQNPVQLASAQFTDSQIASAVAQVDLPMAAQVSATAKASKKSTSLAKNRVAPSLESLCKGQDDKQRAEYAAKIDAMWEAVKNKTIVSNYPTTCAAVYKLAEWLGLVHKDIPSREWKAMLLDRYQVVVSEAIGKYKFEHPPKSRFFREAVRNAFAFAQQSLAPKAKQKPLPGIYQ